MAEAEYQTYKDQGYLMIDLMTDGYQGAVNAFVDTYGMTFPVLNDEKQDVSTALGFGYVIPYFVLIGRDGTVRSAGGSPAPASILEAALAEPWPEVDRPLQPDEMDELDGDQGLPDGVSPFSASADQTWEQGNACAIGGRSASPAAALMLLPLIALILRRPS